MERMEDELRRIYDRRLPPPDFKARVMSEVRVEARRKRGILHIFPRRWAAVGVVAASLLTVFAVQQQKQTRLQRQAEVAEAQLLESLQVAGFKIGQARKASFQPDREGVEP